MPSFISEFVQVLALCEDVDENSIVMLCQRLWHSPRTAMQLKENVEIGYCDNEMALSECTRIERFTGGA